MLEHDETLELIRKSQAGDRQAKSIIIESNMPLIKSIVKRFKNKYIEYEDLIQLGSLGLVKAINNFDTSYNVKFSTYAVPMITGEIKRFIRDDGAIKVSRAVKLLSSKITQFIDRFIKEFSREPNVEEIATEFGIEKEEVIYALDSSHMPVSLYDKYDDDGKNLIEKLPSNDNQDDVIDKIVLRDCIKDLSEREKLIIYLRYYKDRTQSDIARIIGISQVQVSRIESKVIAKMREALCG